MINVAIKMQGVCFKGMNSYGSWDHGKSTYKCFEANLVDHEGF
jgi:hypothetical protein